MKIIMACCGGSKDNNAQSNHKPSSSPINMTAAHTEAYYANCLYSLVNRVIDLVGPVSQHRRSSLNGVIQPSGPHECTPTHTNTCM